MSGYTVKATRWTGGWELHIDGLGVTQVRTLAKAEGQARDYIETFTGEDDAEVTIIPDLGSLAAEVAEARKSARDAARAQEEASEKNRKVIREMRDAGLSVSDMATVMDVSRGRVSQLTEA